MRPPALLLLLVAAACAPVAPSDGPNLRVGVRIGPLPEPTPPEGGVTVPDAPLHGTFEVRATPLDAEDEPTGPPRALFTLADGGADEARLEVGWWAVDAVPVDAPHPGCTDGSSPVTSCVDDGWQADGEIVQVPGSWTVQTSVVLRPRCACE